MGPFTHGEVEAATLAIVSEMFASHELPLDADLWDHYYLMTRNALEAASRFRADNNGA